MSSGDDGTEASASSGSTTDAACPPVVPAAVVLFAFDEDGVPATLPSGSVEFSVDDGPLEMVTTEAEMLPHPLALDGAPGRYQIEIDAPMYRPASVEVDVGMTPGGCGPATVEEMVTLEDRGCTLRFVPAVSLTVVDEAGRGVPLSPGSVTHQIDDAEPEVYPGKTAPLEQPLSFGGGGGTHEITVSQEGYLPGVYSTLVELDDAGCHPVTVTDTLVLQAR